MTYNQLNVVSQSSFNLEDKLIAEYKKYLLHPTKEQIATLQSLRVYLYESEEPKPAACPFAFMEAQRPPESKPPAAPSESTLALWRAIRKHQ